MLKTLPALNTNYDPPRPWVCITHEDHECEGPVVGAAGAIPVCENGATVELAAQERDRQRREALLATPEMQRRLREEARIERYIESRY